MTSWRMFLALQSLHIRASVRLPPPLSFFRGSFTIKCIEPLASAIECIGTMSSGTSEHDKEEHLLFGQQAY
jgi:hypothetical protein